MQLIINIFLTGDFAIIYVENTIGTGGRLRHKRGNLEYPVRDTDIHLYRRKNLITVTFERQSCRGILKH